MPTTVPCTSETLLTEQTEAKPQGVLAVNGPCALALDEKISNPKP